MEHEAERERARQPEEGRAGVRAGMHRKQGAGGETKATEQEQSCREPGRQVLTTDPFLSSFAVFPYR